MFNNYLKIALRNLLRNKVYSFITISGLTIGISICMLLMLYVQDELSYDKFNVNSGKIYRLLNTDHPFQAPQAAKLLADNFPEIEDYARILIQDYGIIEYKNRKFKEEKFAFADAGLFRMFSFNFIHGDPGSALSAPHSVVINKKMAEKYFANENPLGKQLTIDNEENFTVAGVIENMPGNSHFQYDILVSLADADVLFGKDWMNHWGWLNFVTYFSFNPDFSQKEFETKCNVFLKEQNPDEPVAHSYSLQPLEDIHLYSAGLNNDIQPQGNITYVITFAFIGILILLIASINYINLFTSSAAKRSKEIGIKKVVGASRSELARQFLGESFLFLIVSLLFSFFVTWLFLPVFNQLTGKFITLDSLLSSNTLSIILLTVVITGIITGGYPAYILSSLKPVNIISAGKSNSGIKFNFRKVLVIAQFIIVVVLTISAIYMLFQLNYIKNKDLGFGKELVLVADTDNYEDVEKFNSLKNELLKRNDIVDVTVASRIPSGELNNLTSFLPGGQTEVINMPIVHVGYDYFKTFDIPLLEGRDFNKELQTDVDNAVILNESAVKKLNLSDNAVGKEIQIGWPQSRRSVIGVLKDFHFESLYETIKPAAFVIHYSGCWQLVLKIKSNSPANTIEDVEDICSRFYPDWLFEFSFLDQKIDLIYKKEQKTFDLISYFTAFAIFISCLGLLGLSTHIIKNRIKEISIRKVLGASFAQILFTLTIDFVKWIVTAYIIALPIAWYIMKHWMQHFAYSIDLNWGIFLLAGVIVLAIGIATISFYAVKSALTNPVNALKYE